MSGGRAGDVLVVCVNYNNAADTQQFVEEILRQRAPAPIEVTVVDNTQPSDPRLSLPAAVRVIRAERNLGYFGAVNHALTERVARAGLPEWLVIANADVRVEGESFFEELQRLHGDDPPAVIAPTIISVAFGNDQNPNFERRPSGMRMRFYKMVFNQYLLNVSYQAMSLLVSRVQAAVQGRFSRFMHADNPPREIYAPHGAFMLVHRSYFEAGGDLAHGAFLFGEEIYVAEKARTLGLRVLYEPRLRVLHQEHATMGSFGDSRIARHRGEAAAYLADHFFSA